MGNILGSHLETDFSFLKMGFCCLGRVLVLIDFRKGLPADLIIKKGSIEFSEPLDYLGVPFRCYRCHVIGHLMHECTLPFNKKMGSINKIWQVKSDGLNVVDKEGLVIVDKSEELIPTPKNFEESLLGVPLKPLSIISLSESVSLGPFQMDKSSATPDLSV